MASNLDEGEGMLSGYRILDLTDEKGQFCGQLLGSLGADVIKIENPKGDSARNNGPFLHDIPDPEKSLFWFAFNANKRGITLNIETVDGREIFKKLVKTADAVIESFPPGYMDELGFGYSDLDNIKSGIILTSITLFGQTGPYRDYKACDLTCWAIGGALFVCGSYGLPPTRMSHVPQSYLCGSADGAWGTAMALYWYGIHGKGQHVDVSIQASVEGCVPTSQVQYKLTGIPFLQQGDKYGVFPNRPDAPPHIWAIKDGYVHFIFFTGEFGRRANRPFIEWMASEGMADDYLTAIDWSNFAWETTSSEEVDYITKLIGNFFETKTKEEIADAAQQRRIMIQPILSIKEVIKHPQLVSRGFWQQLEYPELGVTIMHPGGFCRPSETICKQWCRAPLIGEHNLDIYQEIGFIREEIVCLRQSGII